MTCIHRTMERKYLKMSEAFKAVMLTGARQVGKSAMLKHLAQNTDRMYVSMDDSDARILAETDPKLFFRCTGRPSSSMKYRKHRLYSSRSRSSATEAMNADSSG